MNLIFFAISLLILMTLFTFLTFNVIRRRRALKIAYKTSHQNRKFQAATSAHRNFVDYSFIGLFLLYIIADQGVYNGWYGLLCVGLVIGRLIHAYGLLSAEHFPKPDFRFRVYGMALTLSTLLFSSISYAYLVVFG